ncbi:MAG: hypothetical protein WA191_08185, partial [Telluria sp.]
RNRLPAQAGTQFSCCDAAKLGSRLRGNDEFSVFVKARLTFCDSRFRMGLLTGNKSPRRGIDTIAWFTTLLSSTRRIAP